jgi:hypothetical protein
MFIGSINRHMRAVLEQAARQWKGLPVYVACSGSFRSRGFGTPGHQPGKTWLTPRAALSHA